MARWGTAGPGEDRQGKEYFWSYLEVWHGRVGLGEAGLGQARQGYLRRQGVAGLGRAGFGEAGLGKARNKVREQGRQPSLSENLLIANSITSMLIYLP